MLTMFPPAETVKVALEFASRGIFTPFNCTAVRCTVPELLSAKIVTCAFWGALNLLGPEGVPGLITGEPGGAVSLQAKGKHLPVVKPA